MNLRKITLLAFGSLGLPFALSAQFNSPYSRYGLGDALSPSNITTRGMGGISAAYADRISVNFSNPASYGRFLAQRQRNSRRLEHGRVIFDAGVNLDSRTLIAPNTPQSFTTNDLTFSYIQVGIPLRENWGLSFGIRPVSRIGYLVEQNQRLSDPVSGMPLDSAITQFRGSGGSYLPSIGTGASFGDFSIGMNMGYLFGNRETNRRRVLINDSVSYYAAEWKDIYSFGGLFFNAGAQFQFSLPRRMNLRLGVAGNWQQTLNGSRDQHVQTYGLGPAGESLQIDSIYGQRDIPGNLIYPSNYTAGVILEKNRENGSGWLFGLDYSTGKWNDYRFFGTRDSVQNNWRLSLGGQFYPVGRANYFSRVTYRFGFFLGEDYIKVGNDLPLFGASFGMALPIRLTRQAPNQINFVNLAFEYQRRGNDDNRLKENLFRLSVGFNFTDLWFLKRRYD